MGIQLSLQKNDVKNIIIVVILCAGEGKRLNEIIKDIPKSLIKINALGNKSILHHTIELLHKLGVFQIAIVKGHLGKKIDEFFDLLTKNNMQLKEKLILIDSLEQYKLGPLYSFLSITKHKNIFQDKYHYLIIPGDTVFQYDLIYEIISILDEKYKLRLIYPLIFYRKIKVSSLRQRTKSESISIIELKKINSQKFLKSINQVKLDDLSNAEFINQIIPVFLFPYQFIQEIINMVKLISVHTIKEIVNQLIIRGSKILAIMIDDDYNFYDIDTELDLIEIEKL